MTTTTIISEEQARATNTCVGCHRHKEKNLVVCWDCFKSGPDPLKYCAISFEAWQRRRACAQQAAP